MFNARPAGPSRPWHATYGLYAWLQFLIVGVLTVGLLLCPLPLQQRRALTSRMARAALWLAGMRVSVERLNSLPRPCVVVANHCSYLDGVVLAALLPPCFSFVIKREMAAVPLAGLLLRRIGAEFVERRQQGRVLRDTRRLLRHALDGQALVFFPEGTFSTQIGLLRFHIGAFAAAARARLPVVPIAIRGTRHCLAPGSLWPRPGAIHVEVLGPLPAARPDADAQAYALWLRERARGALLAAVGEPDLGGCAPATADSPVRATGPAPSAAGPDP